MKKTALLMLWVGLGGCTNVGAQSSINNAANMGASNYGQPAPVVSNAAVYELLGQLEQLQSEVQQLRGLVEEQGHTIADLQRKQDNMYSDLDERIQLLSSGGQPAQQAAAEATQAAADAGQASAAAPEASAPAPEAAAAAPASDTAEQQAPAETKPTETAATAAAQPGEQERYQQAYETLRNGHNAQAIQLFEALYADYPNGEFGDNAQYWLGEAYKINREFDKARAAFNKVISQYPNSSKVPDALLKLGYIELEQQNVAKARDYLTRVTTSYPTTTAAHLAAKKLAQMPQ